VIDASVARRYARALMSLGAEQGRLEEHGEELRTVLRAMKGSKELGFLLVNPGYAQEQRHGAVTAATTALRLSPVITNFLHLLVDRQRIGDLAQIQRSYDAMVDQAKGRVRATVTAARPLAEEEVSRLREALSGMTGHNVMLESRTDAALIGGVVTQVGPLQFDGSLRTQLERLRKDLKSAPV
jgi:F-type H+-transporting ATPase subunit delta